MTTNSKAEVERLREELYCLKEELTNDNKVETCAMVEALEKENTFIPTHTLDVGLELLKTRGVVLITGMAGIGKTRNCFKLMNMFCSEIEPKYQMIKLDNLSEWDEFIDCNKTSIVFVDDLFGKTNANYDKEIHEKILNQVNAFVKKGNIKVIMSTRDTVKRDCQQFIASHPLFQRCEIDLNTDPFQMSVEQKRTLLITYMRTNDDFKYTKEGFTDTTGAIILNNIDIHDIASSNFVIGFPQAVLMFVHEKKYISLGTAFFSRPDEHTLEEINDIRRRGYLNNKFKIQYSLLVLTVLNDNCFDTSPADAIIKVNDIIDTIYGDTIKITKLDLIDSIHTLQGNFFLKHPHIAMFEHQLLFESVLVSFGQIDMNKIIPVASFEFICEMIRTTEYKSKEGEVVLLVIEECTYLLGKRISYLIHREHRHEKAAQLIQRLLHSVLIKSKNELLIDSILQSFVNEENECCSERGMYSLFSFDDTTSRLNKRFSNSAFLPAEFLLYFARKQGDEILFDIALTYITLILEGGFDIDKKTLCKTILTKSIYLLCAFGQADMVEKTIKVARKYCIPISHDDFIAYHQFGGEVISMHECIERAFLFSNLSVLQRLLSKYTLPTFNINELVESMITRKTYPSPPLESLKWLKTSQNIDKKIVLKLSIMNNFEYIADFFWDESVMLQSELSNLFIECCKNRIYNMIPWMIRRVKVNRHDAACAIRYLLGEDRFPFLDDSYEKQIVKIMKIFFLEFDLSKVDIKTTIKLASQNGFFEVVLLFFEKWSPCNFDLPAIFNEACEYCNINMVQWMLDFVEHKLLNFTTAFLKACGGNNGFSRFSYISVVEYNYDNDEKEDKKRLVIKLWNCVDDKTTFNAENAIEKACIVKRFHILQWLLEHMKPEHRNVSQVLQTCCENGQLELIEWIRSNIDTSVVDFKSCLIWLSSFTKNSTITYLSPEGNNRE
ncbi:Hypothetical predicted protein [Mytilus galloprovincialis]|uniref:Novel STAND NTPase 3 domain-containing protein n=1 Tax=Mytilus galloprovincialis TaxID=29158 RepID=A0A8B6FQ33_MYTGA|nr:Hypothetical predicted protein [Mytilus galloprovincialis]